MGRNQVVTRVCATVVGLLAVLASAVPAAASLPRVVVTGDSMGTYLTPELTSALGQGGPVNVRPDIHVGTGLTKPHLFSWLGYPQRQVARYRPDVIVAWLGTADGDALDGARCCDHRPWVRRYTARIEQLTHRWHTAGVRHVYWLTLPAPGDADMRGRVHAVNRALQRARVSVIDIRPAITPGGVFMHAAETAPGVFEPIRWDDGVHITPAGQRLVAAAIAKRLADDLALR